MYYRPQPTMRSSLYKPNTSTLSPKGTRFLLLDSKNAIDACKANQSFPDLQYKFTAHSLVALAINIPLHASSVDTYIESIEKHAPSVLDILSDVYHLERLYHDVNQEIDLQLSVSGEEFHSQTPVFWNWVGQHILMLSYHHEPSAYRTLQRLSEVEVEKHLVAYGQRLS